jgi:hypothetical protein
MSKYYKQKKGNIVLKWINDNPNDKECFKGKVLVKGVYVEVGEISSDWIKACYKPYTPTPQELAEWGETETVSNDNPNKVEVDDKDINLRLECLKLAVMINDNTRKELSYLTSNADEIYDWITKKD